MGVVYLARSPGGALAAVKVIRAEHAADPGFRTRFRREAEAAGRITGPWVVPVLDADSEAREPWLATAFVPGPSLAQVVAADGPLPTVTVRAFGSRLAEVLVAVHEAGLVHRDVKPGNVLSPSTARASSTSGSPGTRASPRSPTPARWSARPATSPPNRQWPGLSDRRATSLARLRPGVRDDGPAAVRGGGRGRCAVPYGP